MPKYQLKCDCSLRNTNGTCPAHSRVKMGIMLEHGADTFKKTGTNGKLANPYWYNYMKNNNQGEENIIRGMVRRFEGDILMKFTNKLEFYDNETKVLIGGLSIKK